jgi:tetratricopeptide (TPR) repeat protein
MPTLEDGRNAISQGNLQQARLIFEALLQENPRYEDAWLGLADVLTDTEDKRICYENALKINKNSRAARDGLRNLEPRANPLIEALSQQAPVQEEELDDLEIELEEEEDEATMISARSPDLDFAADVDSGPSTGILVIIGLALSVIVFAVGGGLVYYLIISLMGG